MPIGFRMDKGRNRRQKKAMPEKAEKPLRHERKRFIMVMEGKESRKRADSKISAGGVYPGQQVVQLGLLAGGDFSHFIAGRKPNFLFTDNLDLSPGASGF